MTEMTGGAVRDSHFCYDHGTEEGVAQAPTKAEQWPNDDFHTTVEVTARQLQESENIPARFPDGVEVGLPGSWLTRDCTFVKITPPEGSQERGARFVRVKLVPENPKERS